MGCPVCEGREGPETLLEQLCEKHSEEAKATAKVEIKKRAALWRRREPKVVVQRPPPQRKEGCGCFGKKKSKS